MKRDPMPPSPPPPPAKKHTPPSPPTADGIAEALARDLAAGCSAPPAAVAALLADDVPAAAAALAAAARSLLVSDGGATNDVRAASAAYSQLPGQQSSRRALRLALVEAACASASSTEADLFSDAAELGPGSVLAAAGPSLEGLHTDFLADLLSHRSAATPTASAKTAADVHEKTGSGILQHLFKAASETKLADPTIVPLRPAILERLGAKEANKLGRPVAAALRAEALAAPRLATGAALERGSVLGALLRRSPTVPLAALVPRAARGRPNPEQRAALKASLEPWASVDVSGAKDNGRGLNGTKALLTQAVASDHLLGAAVLGKALVKDREGVQAYLAAVCGLNAGAGRLTSQALAAGPSADDTLASPAFLLNLGAAMLAVCEPFLRGNKAYNPGALDAAFLTDPRLARLDLSGEPMLRPPTAEAVAAAAAAKEAALAAAAETLELDATDADNAETLEEFAKAMAMSLQPSADALVDPYFLVAGPGPVPKAAMKHGAPTELVFLTARLLHVGIAPAVRRAAEERNVLARALRDSPEGERAYHTHAAAAGCHVYAPKLAGDAVRFSLLLADWLVLQSKAPDAAATFSKIPASLVKDVCEVWAGVVREDAALLPTDCGEPIVAFCLHFLERTDLCASPIVHAKILTVVDCFVRSQRSRGGRGGGGGGRASEALVGAVFHNERHRTGLCPAMISLYSSVHAVEGLDVDVDVGFDKFTVRHTCNEVLAALLSYPLDDPKTSVAALAEKGELGEFAVALCDTVVYTFVDAAERIKECAAIEKAGKHEGDGVQARHYAQQKGVGGTFVRYATSTLALLKVLVRLEGGAAAAALVTGSVRGAVLAERMATMLLTVADWLVGSQAALLAPDPDTRATWLAAAGLREAALVETVGEVLAALAAHPAFAAAVRADVFNSPAVAAAARRAVADGGLGLAGDAAEALFPASAAAASPGKSAAAASAGASALAALRAAPAPDPAAVTRAYVDATEDLQLLTLDGLDDDDSDDDGDASMGATAAAAAAAAYRANHTFGSKTAGAAGKAMVTEWKHLKGMGSIGLPAPDPDAVIAVRADDENMSLMRAAVSGPAGTPYEGGLFLFDVYFPAEYPAVPPILELLTTGGGGVRFNPNLYADGKVCLSLLGTWHGSGDESEKWNPRASSLAQVLMSVQHQILVAEPYFNEPSYEATRGSAEGDANSRDYNANLRAETVRLAMVDALRHPPPGFETFVKAHFAALKPKLLQTLRRWMEDEEQHGGGGPGGKLGVGVAALLAELEKL